MKTGVSTTPCLSWSRPQRARESGSRCVTVNRKAAAPLSDSVGGGVAGIEFSSRSVRARAVFEYEYEYEYEYE